MDEPNKKVTNGTLNSGSETDPSSSLPQIESAKETRREPYSKRQATGPRTERGKQRSSQNAMGPGIFAKAMLVKGESSRQFYYLLRRFKQDVQALEELEGILKEKLAIILWRQGRFLKAEAAEFTRAMQFAEVDRFEPHAFNFDRTSSLETERPEDRQERVAGSESPLTLGKRQALLAPPPEVLERLMGYERHLGRELDRVLSQIERLRRMRSKNSDPPTSSSTEHRGAQSERDSHRGRNKPLRRDR
jgi:hypothetical protein